MSTQSPETAPDHNLPDNRSPDRLRSLDKLLKYASHELRTPLAGIRVMVEHLLMEHQKSGSTPPSFLPLIREECVRMSKMLGDYAEAARLNGGFARWDWKRFSLREVCQSAIAETSSLIDASRVNLSFHIDDDDLEMSGDKDSIRSMLVKLLANACQNTKDGEIVLSCASTDKTGEQQIALQVSDTGSGIPDDLLIGLQTAFNLGAQHYLDHFIKAPGLGLAICSAIAAAHGGRIEIESNKGTSVRVLLSSHLSKPATRNREQVQ